QARRAAQGRQALRPPLLLGRLHPRRRPRLTQGAIHNETGRQPSPLLALRRTPVLPDDPSADVDGPPTPNPQAQVTPPDALSPGPAPLPDAGGAPPTPPDVAPCGPVPLVDATATARAPGGFQARVSAGAVPFSVTDRRPPETLPGPDPFEGLTAP